MITSSKDFWIFHTAYWVAVGLILFLYGLTYGHWEVALVRNLYNPLVGFGCSYLIRAVYNHRQPATFSGRLLQIFLMSLLGAAVSVLLVNPVTFALLNYDLQSLSLGNYLKDGLYFLLFYVVWSLLYLQLTAKPLAAASTSIPPTKLEAISVSKNNQVFSLDPLNITYVQASGDYVEFFTGQESYLKQGTIGSYEQDLASGPFVRIHRSIIINTQKIRSISGPTKGQFWITVGENQEVRSSRKYQGVVEGLVPEAP
jgi:DNA-binding LytR/AlgR family response regulator